MLRHVRELGENELDPTLQFLPTLEADGESLATLRVEAMRESLERIGRFDPSNARRRFLANFNPTRTIKVCVGDQCVGFYALRDEQTYFYVDHLYVRPGHQGQGIGAAVLQRLFSMADERNIEIRLGALKQSDSNRFYVRHGFLMADEGEFDNYYVRQALPNRN